MQDKTFSCPYHGSDMLQQISELWKMKKLCDATIEVGPVRVYTHRVLLLAACPWLNSITSGEDNVNRFEIKLPRNVGGDALNAVLSYLYDGELTLNIGNFLQIEKLANILKLTRICEYCLEFREYLKQNKLTEALGNVPTEKKTIGYNTSTKDSTLIIEFKEIIQDSVSSQCSLEKAHLARKRKSSERIEDIVGEKTHPEKIPKNSNSNQKLGHAKSLTISHDATHNPSVKKGKITIDLTTEIKEEPIEDDNGLKEAKINKNVPLTTNEIGMNLTTEVKKEPVEGDSGMKIVKDDNNNVVAEIDVLKFAANFPVEAAKSHSESTSCSDSKQLSSKSASFGCMRSYPELDPNIIVSKSTASTSSSSSCFQKGHRLIPITSDKQRTCVNDQYHIPSDSSNITSSNHESGTSAMSSSSRTSEPIISMKSSSNTSAPSTSTSSSNAYSLIESRIRNSMVHENSCSVTCGSAFGMNIARQRTGKKPDGTDNDKMLRSISSSESLFSSNQVEVLDEARTSATVIDPVLSSKTKTGSNIPSSLKTGETSGSDNVASNTVVPGHNSVSTMRTVSQMSYTANNASNNTSLKATESSLPDALVSKSIQPGCSKVTIYLPVYTTTCSQSTSLSAIQSRTFPIAARGNIRPNRPMLRVFLKRGQNSPTGGFPFYFVTPRAIVPEPKQGSAGYFPQQRPLAPMPLMLHVPHSMPGIVISARPPLSSSSVVPSLAQTLLSYTQITASPLVQPCLTTLSPSTVQPSSTLLSSCSLHSNSSAFSSALSSAIYQRSSANCSSSSAVSSVCSQALSPSPPISVPSAGELQRVVHVVVSSTITNNNKSKEQSAATSAETSKSMSSSMHMMSNSDSDRSSSTTMSYDTRVSLYNQNPEVSSTYSLAQTLQDEIPAKGYLSMPVLTTETVSESRTSDTISQLSHDSDTMDKRSSLQSKTDRADLVQTLKAALAKKTHLLEKVKAAASKRTDLLEKIKVRTSESVSKSQNSNTSKLASTAQTKSESLPKPQNSNLSKVASTAQTKSESFSSPQNSNPPKILSNGQTKKTELPCQQKQGLCSIHGKLVDDLMSRVWPEENDKEEAVLKKGIKRQDRNHSSSNPDRTINHLDPASCKNTGFPKPILKDTVKDRISAGLQNMGPQIKAVAKGTKLESSQTSKPLNVHHTHKRRNSEEKLGEAGTKEYQRISTPLEETDIIRPDKDTSVKPRSSSSAVHSARPSASSTCTAPIRNRDYFRVGNQNSSKFYSSDETYVMKHTKGYRVNSSADSSLSFSAKNMNDVVCSNKQRKRLKRHRVFIKNNTNFGNHVRKDILRKKNDAGVLSDSSLRHGHLVCKINLKRGTTETIESSPSVLSSAVDSISSDQVWMNHRSKNSHSVGKGDCSIDPSAISVSKDSSIVRSVSYGRELMDHKSKDSSLVVKGGYFIDSSAVTFNQKDSSAGTIRSVSASQPLVNGVSGKSFSSSSENKGSGVVMDASYRNNSQNRRETLVNTHVSGSSRDTSHASTGNKIKGVSQQAPAVVSKSCTDDPGIGLLDDMVAKVADSETFPFPTSWGVGVFQEWLLQKGHSPLFEDLGPMCLDDILMEFYLDIKPKEETTLFHGALCIIRNAIICHLTKSVKARVKNGKDLLYSNALYDTLTNEIRPVTNKGPIRADDLKKLYQSNVLSELDPVSLQRKVWFEIMLLMNEQWKNFNLAMYSLQKDSFLLHIDEHGNKYYVISLDIKDRNTWKDFRIPEYHGKKNCPVHSLEIYLSKLHPRCEAFFQQPHKSPKEPGYWYKPLKIAKGRLQSMMTKISIDAKLSQIYTNVAVKATSVLLM